MSKHTICPVLTLVKTTIMELVLRRGVHWTEVQEFNKVRAAYLTSTLTIKRNTSSYRFIATIPVKKKLEGFELSMRHRYNGWINFRLFNNS